MGSVYRPRIEAEFERIRALALAAPGPLALSILRGMARALGDPPAPAVCQWRGELVERAACGCADRNIYRCLHPAAAIDGNAAPVSGAICRDCKYRAAPKKQA